MILRMRSVPALDITALNSLARLWKECQRHRVQLILSHVNEQPLSVMRKSGFYEAVGRSGSVPTSTPPWSWLQALSMRGEGRFRGRRMRPCPRPALLKPDEGKNPAALDTARRE